MYSVEFINLDFGKVDKKILANAAKQIRNSIDNKSSYYQIFAKQDSKKSLEPLLAVADKIKNNFSDLIVISMGGATLNPNMLVSFLGKKKGKLKIHFLNNTDPSFFADLMLMVDMKSTAILAISNSGKTLETNALIGCVLKEFEKNNVSDIGSRSFFITNTIDGSLKNIAAKIQGTIVPHQQNISGRYSGLSSVSLLIGLIADIDVSSYIDGANSVIEDFYTNLEESKPFLSAASIYYNDKNILVNLGYLQKFEIFLEWYSQIIAESLGKEGGGYTPIRGLGPNDQHSMLQLYLDGPKDKLFTMIYVDQLDEKLSNYRTSNLVELEYLANKSLADINNANFTATMIALKTKDLPIRNFILHDVSAKSFGALVAHFMLEIVCIGHLMNINPFNQPGVELIKTNSMSLMSRS